MQLMENNFVENSSLRYPKLKTNLFARHGIERKLKESFLTPLKLPFEGSSSYCKFGVKKVNTCDKCLQTELFNTVNLENVVSKATNEEEQLNVDVQLVISLTDSSGGSGALISSPLIEYKFYNANSHLDNVLGESKNYMDFESTSKRTNRVVNYELKIDCQSLLTFIKNINQKCAENLDQKHRTSPAKKLCQAICNSSEIHESGNFETFKKISKDKFDRKLKISNSRLPTIGMDRNLSCKYLSNNIEQLLVTNSYNIPAEDPCVSNFAKTLLSYLDTRPKKRDDLTTEYKIITDSNETENHDIVDDLKAKIEEIKQQLPSNSPIDALVEVCGPKSHITDMILNSSHQKKVVHKQSDSRFRTIRKISNTDALSQTNSNPDDECLKLLDTPSSSKQSERSNSRPNTPCFEIENFYVPNSSSDYLKNEIHTSLKSNVCVIDTLYNLHDNVLNMENNLILFHQYICSIKSEIGRLIFKHTYKQTNIEELLKRIENESKMSNFNSTQCKELCEKYCEFDGSSSNKRTTSKTLSSSQVSFPLKFPVALSVFFVIGFICGDFVK